MEERRRIDRENERQRRLRQLKYTAMLLKRAARDSASTQLAPPGSKQSPNQSAPLAPKLWHVVKKTVKKSGSKDGTLPALPASTLTGQEGPWASHERCSSGPDPPQSPTLSLEGTSNIRGCSSEPSLPQVPAASPQIRLPATVAAMVPAVASPPAAAARGGGTAHLAADYAKAAEGANSSAPVPSSCIAHDLNNGGKGLDKNTTDDRAKEWCGLLNFGQRLPEARHPRAQNSHATADVIAATFPGLQSVQNTLFRLTGPLSFGAAFTEASTLAQASNRARRVFRMIVQDKELLLPTDETDRYVIDVKAVVRMLRS